MRVELRDGQWAELRERINHGQDKELRRAFRLGKQDPDKRLEFETILGRIFVRAWNVLDPDGVAIPIEDPDAIDRAPDDIIDQLIVLAHEQWTGIQAPPTPTPPSSDA